jgi:hypothetical protein
MKQKVIEFFQNLPEAKHEQFNKAFELYRQSEGKSLGAEKVINATGYTPASLENLLYDLQKLHDISDVEKFSIQYSVSSEQIAELESEKEDLEFENEHLKDENEDLKSEVETLKLAPKLDAKAIRVEFPFLNDAACPDELKILMADKISAWNRYLEAYEKIQKIKAGELVVTEKESVVLALICVSNFKENKEIYDELNCYQTTGKVLGVHPIFKKLQLSREVETMTADELIKYKGSSAKYFSVKKTALAKAKKAKDEAKVTEIEVALAERHDKLFLVNKKLGV